MPSQLRFASAIASGVLILAGGLLSIAPTRAEEPPANADHPPFASPLTDEEGRWLLDAEDAQRFPALPERQLQEVAPRDLPPQIRAIQRSMGGSLLEQFNELQPAQGGAPWWKQFGSPPAQSTREAPIWPNPSAENTPPGMWPNWSSPAAPATIHPASAETPAAGRPVPVSALRTTAAELDNAANRLEVLELYPQSDALRELAQRFRVDARRMAARDDAGAAPWTLPTDSPPQPQRPRRRAPNPTPDLAPTPSDPAAGAETPADSGDAGSDAWNAPSPQVPTPAE